MLPLLDKGAGRKFTSVFGKAKNTNRGCIIETSFVMEHIDTVPATEGDDVSSLKIGDMKTLNTPLGTFSPPKPRELTNMRK